MRIYQEDYGCSSSTKSFEAPTFFGILSQSAIHPPCMLVWYKSIRNERSAVAVVLVVCIAASVE